MTAPERPHVVMLVANDVTADTRVRKSALAVAALGARVTVIGLSPVAGRSSSRLGDVEILRVPVDFVLRDARRQRRARWHRGQFGWLTVPADVDQRRRLRRVLAERATAAGVGRQGSQVSAFLAGRRNVAGRDLARADRYARRRLARGLTLGFKLYDRAVQRQGWFASPSRTVPEVDDLELAIGPVLDGLAPDLIHAHDVHFMAVAARAVSRAESHGRTMRWVYDAHEWVPGLSRYGGRTARVVAAWAALERRWIGSAQAVVTVSPPLARALQERYRLPTLPDVVLNVPVLGAPAPVQEAEPGSGSGQQPVGDVRSAAGVPGDVPLLVYSGGVQAARGVESAVEALVHLPQAHLVVVAVPSVDTPAVAAVRRLADRLAVADRVRVLPPVRPDQVVTFLSTADVGLIPLHHYGSHEMALANKLFEYLHARVPMVVSDCRAQAEFVTEYRLGSVHRAGDGADLAAAVRRALAEADQIRQRMADPALTARYTWAAQAQALQQVYRRALPELADAPAVPAALLEVEPQEKAVEQAGRMLVIGPANSAGQGHAWAHAAAERLPGVVGWNIALRNDKYDYPADELVSRRSYRTDADWQLGALARARSLWTHVLIEAGRPILGGVSGGDFLTEARLLGRSGVQVGLVFHGSEVRDPRRHRLTHQFSPFTDPRDELTRSLQARCDTLLPQIAGWEGPVFASTPDQLEYLPERAQWLPVVIDTTTFRPDATDAPVPLARRRPLVVHAPSHPALKGTTIVEQVLGPMAEQGLIELRMVTGVPPAEAAALVRSADVVLDQLLLGLYGVLAGEAMACGRVVLGNVGDSLRARVEAPVPIIEVTPRTLCETMERVLAERDWAQGVAADGPAFVTRFHDGRRSAAVLAPFLGVPFSEPPPAGPPGAAGEAVPGSRSDAVPTARQMGSP